MATQTIPNNQRSSVRFSKGLTFLALLTLFISQPASAWIFHEHQVMAERAIQDLPQDELNDFDAIWQELREIAPERLCKRPDVVDLNDDDRAQCVPFSAFPAIAGDHSCSAEQMWRTVTGTKWIMDVVNIAFETRLELGEKTGADRVNAWNYSNLRFERADPEYSSRASSNYSHFVPMRTTTDLAEYVRRSLLSDTTINALAAYALPHWAALRFALEASLLEPGDERRRELIRLALSAEAFALHYLEDAFSAGHVVGRWGSTADAKGTHDHYCMHGIDAATWDGEFYSAYGDAYMREADLMHGLKAVRMSLQQLLEAFRGDIELEETMEEFDLEEAEQYRLVNGCKPTWVNLRIPSEEILQSLLPIWKKTLKPGPGPGKANLPRFKAEIGSFFGFSFNMRLGAGFGGYDSSGGGRFLADVAGFAAFGFGVEGVTGMSSDGTFMLGVGMHGQAPQFDLGDSGDNGGIGSEVARVPGRLGLAFLVRLPFYLIPGDLVIFGPLIAPFSMGAVKHMAINAADGGLIPWQRVLVTGAGDFQIVVGREVQVTLFGIIGSNTILRYNGAGAANPYTALKYGSIELDFPVLQWRFFRAFSQRLTSALVLTLGGGVDFPVGAEEIASGASTSLGTAGFFYLRFSFDGRIYYEGLLDQVQ